MTGEVTVACVNVLKMAHRSTGVVVTPCEHSIRVSSAGERVAL